MKWILMNTTYVCPCCGSVSTSQPDRCPSCAATLDPWKKVTEPNWVLKTCYSWGEEEPDKYFATWEKAIAEMRNDASYELMNQAEHDYQASLYVPNDIGINKDARSSMEIHYEYDDTYCYYVVEKF